jgi:hypothetical protein
MANRIPTLTESELYAPTPPHLFEALTQAAEQREKLADKLDDLASAF